MPDSSHTPQAPRGAVPDRLIDCPTVGVCPPCSEGWGHWNGERYFPTKHSTGWHRACGCSPSVHRLDTECPRPAFRALVDNLTATDNDRDLLAITRRERDHWESEASSWQAVAMADTRWVVGVVLEHARMFAEGRSASVVAERIRRFRTRLMDGDQLKAYLEKAAQR